MNEQHPDDFQEIKTFTGETVWYNPVTHVYTTVDGVKLVSGSEYAESMSAPFDMERLSWRVARKYGVTVEDVRAMWEMNGLISRTFGNALHYSMEQWFRHRYCGTAKEYHLPKPLYLREAVLSFPHKGAVILPEVAVSDVAGGRVGRVDALHFIKGLHENVAEIVDFKSDNNVKKNLERHQHQLNFYRVILEAKGFVVPRMVIWNYVKEWTEHVVPRIQVKESREEK